MQRPNNAGGPGGGIWTTTDIGVVPTGNAFASQSRNIQHPTSNIPGRESIPVYRLVNPTQQANPLHYKPGWGQSDTEALAQQSSSTALWKSDGASGHASSDQTRSLLGTEQWGRESGGAPWGSTSKAELSSTDPVSSSPTTHATDPAKMSSSWLAKGNTMFQANMDREANKDPDDKQKPTDASIDKTDDGSTSSTSHNKSPNASPVEEEKWISEEPSTTKEKPSQNNKQQTANEVNVVTAVSDEVTKQSEPVTSVGAEVSPPTDATSAAAQQVGGAEGAQEATDVDNVEADGAGATPTEELQQLNLMDSYAQQQQQQQTIAAQFSYQLLQQQYALAAQQQQLAPGGMFLPSSYIIPAQAGPAGYTDPNAPNQFPVMAHYSPYASWPATGMYPAMLQQQMAAVAASVSSQQTYSPATSQPNRPSAQTPQSPSESPTLQPQETQQSQSEILAAMQQSNINQAMAMAAGYPIIPSAYYDQTGALIINNGRGGGPVRLFAPNPMLLNGSQPWIPPQMPGGNGSMFRYNQAQQTAAYANQQNISGGSTPVPSINQGFNPPVPPVGGGVGSSGNISNLGIGTLGTGIGSSSSSTPQRRDSFSDFPKHPQPPYSGISQFYNPLGLSPASGSGIGMGTMSPSPGPLSGMMGHSHPGLSSPPPSMSSGNMMLGNNNRMFSVAPGAEAKYRNSPYMSHGIFGNSGSSLFPPTRIRPPNAKDMMAATGRSKLLDDFRNNRLPNAVLQELVNHIVEFSQDQHGSRFIQQKLERATLNEKQQVFNEIIGSAYQLMTDVFGNYVIQKFFEFGSLEHKLALADCIHGHVLPLALQMYGCRVIQKALECIPQEKQVEIVKELDGHLLKCVKDQNGNHVVQKCIECVPPVHLNFIVDGFKGQVVTLSSHPYGCRVMQRILEHCTEEQTAPILEELHQHTEMLVKDQYGNYVIQHILEHGRPEHKHQMVNELRGKILALSQHKFASNVIEKCVSHSSHQNRAWLIEEVCQEPDALFIMMKDQFANYVVQKMLDVAEPQQKKLLIHKIRPHVLTLRKFTYGKHIITKLEKFFLKSSGNSPSPGASASTGELPGPQMVATASWVLDSTE